MGRGCGVPKDVYILEIPSSTTPTLDTAQDTRTSPATMDKEDTKRDHKNHKHTAPNHGRALDRKDGTGRGQQQSKKGGGGSHNWSVSRVCEKWRRGDDPGLK